MFIPSNPKVSLTKNKEVAHLKCYIRDKVSNHDSRLFSEADRWDSKGLICICNSNITLCSGDSDSYACGQLAL